MDMSSREIRVPLDEVVAVLQDLNAFVVSLDRLGSRQAAGTADPTTGLFFSPDPVVGGTQTPTVTPPIRSTIWTRTVVTPLLWEPA